MGLTRYTGIVEIKPYFLQQLPAVLRARLHSDMRIIADAICVALRLKNLFLKMALYQTLGHLDREQGQFWRLYELSSRFKLSGNLGK